MGSFGGGGGGGSSSQTVTQTSEPPEWMVPYAKNVLARAQSLSKKKFAPYTGDRIAGLTGQHLAGVDTLSNQPGLTAARNVGMATLRGDYFNANPYLDQAFGRAAGAVQGQLTSSALGGAGGMTNSGVQETYRNQMNNLAQDIYGANYQLERDRQLAAAQYLPGLEEQSARMQLAGGDILRDFSQSQLNENVRKYEEARRYPYESLDVLARSLGMAMGGGYGTVTSTQPSYYEPNSTATMLGTGLAGLGALQGLGWLG